MKWLPVCLLSSSAYLVGCGEHPSKIGVEMEEASPEAVVAAPAGPLSPEEAYNRVCVTCHKADGEGESGRYPPLAGSRWLNGNPDVPIRIVLYGLAGDIEVRGETYTGQAMAAQYVPLRSSDANVAAAISYARTSWGNEGGAITEEQVRAVREDPSITGVQLVADLEPLLDIGSEPQVDEGSEDTLDEDVQEESGDIVDGETQEDSDSEEVPGEENSDDRE